MNYTIYSFSLIVRFPAFLYLFCFFGMFGNNPFDDELLELLELGVILFGGVCRHFFVYVPLPSLFLFVFTKLYVFSLIKYIVNKFDFLLRFSVC